MKTILKAAGYLFTYTAATVFIYNVFMAGIFFKTNPDLTKLALSDIESGVYVPMIYAFLSLTILILSQTRLIKSDSSQEKMIYGLFNIVFFVMVLALGIIMVSQGATKQAEIFSVCGILVTGLAVIEIGYGIFLLVQQSKMKKLEAEEEAKAPQVQKAEKK